MIQKQLFGYGVMCLIFLAVRLASPLKQSRLQRQLDKLDIKTRRENLLRRDEINGLYTIMERIEERINNTLPNFDKPIDKPRMDDKQAGIGTVDDVRITEILKEVYYLKRGFMDEKKLASRVRGQVVQLNHTVSQLMLQMGQRMQAMSAFNASLDETKITMRNLVLGQNELKTFINTIQDDMERQANETKQVLQNMEMKLKEPSETTAHKEPEYSSCVDLMENGMRVSGVYDITLPRADSVKVYCDLTTDGGGWTVFQRRQDGSVDFERTWQEYKDGFGDLDGEFWLGNDNLYRLLSLKDHYELRIDMIGHNNNAWYAQYGNFMVGSEGKTYMLTAENFSGTSGDALWFHNQMKFSTKDSDNDMSGGRSCAEEYKGGWWYNHCHWANLNGNFSARDNTGIRWYASGKGNTFLKVVEMKFREV